MGDKRNKEAKQGEEDIN